MIETEIVLYSEEREPTDNGTLILVPDDPSLYELGKIMEKMYHLKDSVIMVRKSEILHKLRSLTSAGKSAYGIIWSADLQEERLRGRAMDVMQAGKIDYYDDNALYGRPALCLLGRPGQTWNTVPGRPRVLMDRGFPNIASEFLRSMDRDYDILNQPAEGCLGTCGYLGKIDLAVSMVYSDDIIDRTGMVPLQRIMDSEPTIIRIGD